MKTNGTPRTHRPRSEDWAELRGGIRGEQLAIPQRAYSGADECLQLSQCRGVATRPAGLGADSWSRLQSGPERRDNDARLILS